MSEINKEISLSCPTCGNDDFEYFDENDLMVKCVCCSRQMQKEDLIQENGERIHIEIDKVAEQIKQKAIKDIQSELKKTFGNNKNVTLKF